MTKEISFFFPTLRVLLGFCEGMSLPAFFFFSFLFFGNSPSDVRLSGRSLGSKHLSSRGEYITIVGPEWRIIDDGRFVLCS